MAPDRLRAGMCGRYTVGIDPEKLWQELELEGEPQAELAPRYNVAPTQEVPAVLDRAPRELVMLRWGLVPFFAKDLSIGHRLINARAEGIADKPAFRRAFEKRRCLIPADGFYEWARQGKIKVPHYITLRTDRPMTFAGLWEVWHDPDDNRILTCTIVTTDARGEIGEIHDRMPVILPPDARAVWLDRAASRDDLLALLRPFRAGELTHHEVSRLVNTPANDTPECIVPVSS